MLMRTINYIRVRDDSHEGAEWLDARLDEAFARRGRLTASELARLDWPKKDPALEGAGWSRGEP